MSSLKKTGLHTVKPGHKFRVRDVNPGDTGVYKDKAEVQERLAELSEELVALQEKLYAEGRQSLLIVFQAMDTGGKDGVLKHLMTGINPAGVQVTAFKAPSSSELAHDFLWRCHAATPARGMIGVWNRSHYEDVLVTRVHGLVSARECEKRYETINDFERALVRNRTAVCKFYLHISKDEQKERLQARLDDPDKHWKFSVGDLAERAHWEKYMEAFEDAISATSTKDAPWHVVPANHKWARDLAVAECVVATLKKMKPQYPKVSIDPAKIVIE